MDIKRVTLGSAFKLTWVNSGITASPIVLNIQTGSETLVQSVAGTSSGNGHYYANATIATSYAPGIYRGRWYATYNSNSYASDMWLEVYPDETGQPGRYTNWDRVVAKYEDFVDFGGAVKAASHYLASAEAKIDGMLGVCFTIPFSDNNATVRDLATDMAFLEAARRSISEDEFNAIKGGVDDTIKMLKAGDMVMVTDSGTNGIESIPQGVSGAWSSTEDYHPIQGPRDPLDWLASSQQNIDLLGDRGIVIS